MRSFTFFAVVLAVAASVCSAFAPNTFQTRWGLKPIMNSAKPEAPEGYTPVPKTVYDDFMKKAFGDAQGKRPVQVEPTPEQVAAMKANNYELPPLGVDIDSELDKGEKAILEQVEKEVAELRQKIITEHAAGDAEFAKKSEEMKAMAGDEL